MIHIVVIGTFEANEQRGSLLLCELTRFIVFFLFFCFIVATGGMNTDDESDRDRFPFSVTSLSPTKTSAQKNVRVAETNSSGDDDEELNVHADASETKAVIPLPKKRTYVVLKNQTEGKLIIKIITERTETGKEVIASLPTKQSCDHSGLTDKKSQEPELAVSDKPDVKPARKAGKKHVQQASTSHPSTSQPSTSQLLTSHPSTSHPSTSQPSTSQLSTSHPSTSQPSTSKTSKSKSSKSSTSKAPTSKASTSKASTSTASKSKESPPKATRKARSTAISSEVREEAGQNLPSGEKPSASTSVASSSIKCKDSQFWLETVKSKFKSSAYKAYLRESGFTEPQAGVIQNVFHRTAQQLYNTFRNSDRVKKTFKCQECVFSVSHQCVSFRFLHAGWPNDPTIATLIEPQKTFICVCQFALFHAHTTIPSRPETEKTASSELTQPLLEVDRIVTLRCAVCDTLVMIEHPFFKSADCKLTKWSAINSQNEKTFHAQIVDHLKCFTRTPLSLEELYICSNHCCLFFHRCTE